jgi:hypothetical protein
MTSLKQIEVRRRNARKRTGTATQEDEDRSRCTAIRHGLTVETVINVLEDVESGLQNTDDPARTLQSQHANKVVSKYTRGLRRLLVAITKLYVMFTRGFLSSGEPIWREPEGSQAAGHEMSDASDRGHTNRRCNLAPRCCL